MKDVIIIPTYNEKESIQTIVPLVFRLLPDITVVVADDNSPDGTGMIVLGMQKQYPNLSLISRKQKDGLGKAYINAFREVLKDKGVRAIIMMDADFTAQLKFLPEMMTKSKDYSVVIGSRYVSGSKILGWQLWRKVLSFSGNFYCRIILRMPIRDYTCGFNVISADLLRKVDLSKMDASGYAFILELKYILYKVGATFFEVPITFVDRVGGESKISSHIISEGVFAPWKMIFGKNNHEKR
ncbi:MAG: polyprenol monophosphomannose synthase [Minisyncoccia bacterium]